MLELAIHPVAKLMPGLTEPEMESLKHAIARDGQLVPIMVLENEIIDGRHRYWACRELGIEPVIATWNGPTDPEGLAECAVALNVARRHLPAYQRAALSVNLLPMFEEQAKERMLATQNNHTALAVKGKFPEQAERGQARDKVAAIFSVDPTYVSRAKAIKEWNEEVFNSITRGETTLQDAAKLMRDSQPKPTPPVTEQVSTTPPCEHMKEKYGEPVGDAAKPGPELIVFDMQDDEPIKIIPDPHYAWEENTVYHMHWAEHGWIIEIE